MRYFLAIPLPEDVKQKFHSINKDLSEIKGLRFVSPDNMHLTLLFLGENGAKNKVEELKKLSFDNFVLETDKVSLFPEEGKFRLVWVNLKKSSELNNIQKQISKLFKLDKDYKPHITLARVKKLSSEDKFILTNKIKDLDLESLKINVKNFKLYSSELTVLGPVHRVIEYFESSKN